MELNELTDEELVTLAGLMREVIRADQEYSAGEQERVVALRVLIGQQRFDRVFAEAGQKITSRDALKERAKTVTRQAARQAMYDYLTALAAVDGVASEEEKPLRWLASWWDL